MLAGHTYSVQRGPIPDIRDRLALLPDHYSIADGTLFIILIKMTLYLVVLCLVPNGGICVLTQEQIP